MKIVITTVQIPFVQGGAEFLAANLKKALIDAGHQVEIITMPFSDQPAQRIEDNIVASRLMDVSGSWGGNHDLCIGLKFPAYYMPHPNKVIWALHQHRAAFDLFDTPYSSIKNDATGIRTRNMIYNAERTYLPEAKRIYTISQNVTYRMEHYTGIASKPLYHPCPDAECFYHAEAEDYILMPSRINMTKRQMFALEALTKTKSDVKLCLLGRPDNETVGKEIMDYINQHDLCERVRVMNYVSQEKKFELYAKAKAVLFIPYDEDYGYITLEAMAAGKAVITMEDSGGPLEFVLDEKTGIISKQTADELAKHLDEIWTSENMAEEYGRNGKQHLDEMEITWQNVVKELIK